MTRYARIESLRFGATALPLPISVRVTRRAGVRAAAGAGDRYASSVEFDGCRVEAEVRLRGTAAAENLAPGEEGTLAFTVSAMRAGASGRSVRISGAVLTSIEIAYEQTSAAVAVLRLTAESDGGAHDPHAAEDDE